MRAIDFIEAAYREFPLRDQFVEVERQILRERTVAQVSFKSETLGLMLKLFVSEMEGEAQVYVAPLGTTLGYREDGGWQYWWPLERQLADRPGYNREAIEALQRIEPLRATSDIQLQAKLKWFTQNVTLIREYFNLSA